MISLRTYQTWIKRSAELLDRDVPDWHKNINLNMLDMGDNDYCICGQLGINHQPNPDHVVDRKKLSFGPAFTNNLDYSVLRGFYIAPTFFIKGKDNNQISDIQLRLWVHQINKRLKQEKA